MRTSLIGVVGLLVATGFGCKRSVEYYCDKDTPCLPRYPDRPFCDLSGAYEPDGIRNTCVPSPADAGISDGSDGGGSAVSDASPADAALVDAAQNPDPILEDVIHVPAIKEFAGVADLSISGTVLIDTSDLTLDGANPPSGAVFDTSPQEDVTGPGLAILHIRTLTVEAGATLRVVGSRPIAIIASQQVTISGVIDVSADRGTPGAGGATSGSGNGAGGDAPADGGAVQPGGGGAGFGSFGGSGGDGFSEAGGQGGATYGSPSQSVLFGGSAGGLSADCPADTAGAGGGAIDIYSAKLISIPTGGGINAGGGGGAGGNVCGSVFGGGGGGGSGGAIFLQAPSVTQGGTLAANGAGGGSGAGKTGSQPGTAGNDATLDASVAPGAVGPGGNGGAGAVGTAAATSGEPLALFGGGGGGGGGVGRITVLVHANGTYDNTGATTPPASTDSY